jgi:hypothetical protein
VNEYILYGAVAIFCLLAALLVLVKARGVYVRIIAIALFLLALANPSITREDRDPLTSVAAVIIDKSPSQDFDDRTKQTEAARADIAEKLGKLPGIEAVYDKASLPKFECRFQKGTWSGAMPCRATGWRARS